MNYDIRVLSLLIHRLANHGHDRDAYNPLAAYLCAATFQLRYSSCTLERGRTMGYAYFPTFSGPITSIAPTDFKRLFYYNILRILIYFFKYLFLYMGNPQCPPIRNHRLH